MRVVFMGTPDFSVPVLRALVGAHEVVCVYCQPPRPAGRGRKDRPSPVQDAAEAMGLPVRHPVSLKAPATQADFAALKADIAVVVAYGLILPQAVLDAPRHGCLNIHASLLPRWRGAAPIHRAILAGDAETGVCIMAMEAGLDTGPVLLRQATPIGPEETTHDLHDRLSAMGADLILSALDRLPDLTPEPQPESGVTYAAKIDKAEARVDWTAPSGVVDRQIRGLILKALLKSPALSAGELVKAVGKGPARTTGLIHTLIKEGFLEQEGDHLRIAAGAEATGTDSGNP
jgi:methionyl-tRNA formyltransferase